MARVISADQFSTITEMRDVVESFNYAQWNAAQNAEFERAERRRAKSIEDLAKEQRKREQLMAEYARLKELYVKTGMDRRLKKSTRQQRLDDIIEAMINIEDLVCI